ncbi:multidrug effflux MFS transporter [Vibrio sp. SS-MA-C1-2]|uniref:multidrug effflux MFS transporter n=1 Tax=Vibrio sp. SS-MA-C1-2 TaxID=2908646 RepID=UPI001F3BC7CA|nr:multidrug effflux MFS transporter [Vibrio sp. SS-MA-C1-2]UJF18878.1 multidrug effflux MFS transporter [Vibrio sp. SS-MA-C1-2]
MNKQQTSEGTFRFLITIVFLAAAMETDIYLPAFPDMMVAYNTNEVMIQRILSFNFLGICLSSLVYGPLSDSFGRKKILNVGYLIFIIASFGCVFANTIETLIVFRFIQGFGSAACMIVGSAMIFDRFTSDKAAKVIGDLNSLVVSILAFAPMLGGWINLTFGYHYNFLFIAVLTLVTGAMSYILLPETLVEEKRKPLSMKTISNDYKIVLKSGDFWTNCMIVSFMFSGYIIFVSNMSILFINYLNVNENTFPYYQVALLVSFVLSSVNSGRLIDRFGSERMKNIGLCLMSIATMALVLLPSSLQSSPLIITAVMTGYSFGAGFCIGIFFAKSMDACPDQTGVSASLVTAIRLVVVAILIDVSSGLFDGTSTSVINMVGLCMASAVLIYLGNLYYKKKLIQSITPY